MSAPSSTANQELVAKLSGYLAGLSQQSRASLVRSIDRARARGENSAVHTIIMEAVRQIPDEQEAPAERPLSAERKFFDPVEPFLVPFALTKKQPMRVERRSLRPIWVWITRDLVPGKLDADLASVRAAVTEDDTEATVQIVRDFRAAVAVAAREELAHIKQQHGSYQRLESQLGGEQILLDFLDVLSIFEKEAALSAFFKRLPEHIPGGKDGFELLDRALKSFQKHGSDDPLMAYTAGFSRLENKADLVLFAISRAASTDPAYIRRSPAKDCINVVLSQIAIEAEQIALQLENAAGVSQIVATLKRFDDLSSAVFRNLEEAPTDPWLKQLAGIRVETGERISSRISALLGQMKSVVSVIENKGVQIIPDRASIADAVFSTALFVAARDARDSLALNAVIEPLEKGAESILENQARAAIERLGHAEDQHWEAALARSQAAVQLFRAYHGSSYGAAMAKRHNALVESRSTAKARENAEKESAERMARAS
ncbi:MAG: hypothetical protein AAGH60_00790 [Pseudomonadota bacterium]